MLDSFRECPQCGSPVEDRPNKKFCSDACKGRHFRENNEPGEESAALLEYEPPEETTLPYYSGRNSAPTDIKSVVEDYLQKINREDKERKDKEQSERKAKADEDASKKIHQQFCVLIKEFLEAEGKPLTEKPVNTFLEQVDILAESYRNHPYLKLPDNLIRARLKELYHVQDIIREVAEDIKNKWSQKARFELTGKWRKQLRELLIED